MVKSTIGSASYTSLDIHAYVIIVLSLCHSKQPTSDFRDLDNLLDRF